LHKGRVFSLVTENITLKNGVTVDVDVIRHPGAAAIVALHDAERVILIKQYRHALRDCIWEIPAGTLDADESPLQCAQRELTEETGYRAADWHRLGEIVPVPGYSNERVHIFAASNLAPATQSLDRDELLEVHLLSLAEVENMIAKGLITDGKTLAGLFMTLRWLRQG